MAASLADAAADAVADATAALAGATRARGSELLEFAADRWHDNELALTILHNFQEWQDTIQAADIYKALTQRRWKDRRSGVVYAFMFGEASILSVFAAASAGRPERVPDRLNVYEKVDAASTYYMHQHLSDDETAAGEPSWIVTELESLGFERTNSWTNIYHNHLDAPGQASPRQDERLLSAMRAFAQVARSMREVYELEVAVESLAVD